MLLLIATWERVAKKANSLTRLYSTRPAKAITPTITSTINPFLLFPHEVRNVSPGIPVLIEKPLVPIDPRRLRTLPDTPDLLTLSPAPLPRLIRFWYRKLIALVFT